MLRGMTDLLSLAGLPLYVNHAARQTEKQTAAGQPRNQAPLIGASDAEADAAGSGAAADLTHVIHDSDGVPVGAADLVADKRNSGGRLDPPE
jgi:hypothetical protein